MFLTNVRRICIYCLKFPKFLSKSLKPFLRFHLVVALHSGKVVSKILRLMVNLKVKGIRLFSLAIRTVPNYGKHIHCGSFTSYAPRINGRLGGRLVICGPLQS